MLRIKTILKAKNLTNVEIARQLGVSPQYVSDVVNERKNITLEVISRFASVLDVPIAALFDGYISQSLVENSVIVPCPHCGKTLCLGKY